MSTHPFDAAIALRHEPPRRWQGRTNEAYGNMVSPVGGVTAGRNARGMILF
jgi:hypothetical protein